MGTILSLTGLLAIHLLAFQSSTAQTEDVQGKRESEESILAREDFFRKQRMGVDGQDRTKALLRAQEELDSRIGKSQLRTPLDAGIWNWESLGPGNIGGRARALIIHPDQPDIMWLGTAQGGIWKTTDGGMSWSPMSDFLPALGCVSLAIDPINLQTLYAGTGEFIGSNGLYVGVGYENPGAGIFKSTNGGASWFQLASTDSSKYYFVSRLAHHPTLSNRVLAATATGVYRTTDGGTSWSAVLSTSPGEYVMDVKYDPANPSRIVAGTFKLGTARGDAYLSTDGGTHWDTLTSGKPGKMPLSPGECDITFTPSNTRIMYVSIGKYEKQGRGEIWRSNDGGVTWKRWWFTYGADFPDAWSNAMWVSPTDSNLVVWGGFGNLFRTTTAGAPTHTDELISDWRLYTTDGSFASAHGDQHAIVSHPHYNGGSEATVFVVNDGGIQRTTNIKTVTTSSGWTTLANHLGITQFFGGAASPDGGLIIGGAQDLGALRFRSTDGPEGWRLSATGDGQYCAVDQVSPGVSFMTFPDLNVLRSTDGGQQFGPAFDGILDTNSNALWMAPLVMDPNYPNRLIAGGLRIWRTVNSASKWYQIRPAVSGNPLCSAIDISPSDSSVIWLGYDNGLVSYTSDGGGTWIDRGFPGGNRFVTDIAVNPHAWNEVIVTLGGYDTNTVWFSSNTGVNWVKRNGVSPGELPAVQVYTVRYHPIQSNWVYVGTDLGVFASEDKGVNWSITPRYQSSEGPNYTEVRELFWQGTSFLIAATHGRGMWRCMPLPIVYVDGAYTGTSDGTEFRPYKTVYDAVNAYGPGALVSVKSGTYNEPVILLNKRGNMRATGGAVQIK